jgi:hypothetical protein
MKSVVVTPPVYRTRHIIAVNFVVWRAKDTDHARRIVRKAVKKRMKVWMKKQHVELGTVSGMEWSGPPTLQETQSVWNDTEAKLRATPIRRMTKKKRRV